MSVLIATRLKEMSPPLNKAMLNIFKLISDLLSIPPICYAGDPPRPIELNEVSIAAYLKRTEYLQSLGGLQISRLESNPRTQPSFDFSIREEEEISVGLVETLWFLLPKPDLELSIKLTAGICLEFGAFNGSESYCYDLDNTIIPPQEDPLANLLNMTKFNYRYVPFQVSWLNFWDRIQVETVGRSQIYKAPWARIIEQPEGALVLIPTEEPTDFENPAHLEHLRLILNCLDLPELQKRYQVKHQET